MTDIPADNIVPLTGDARWLNDSFVNFLAGLGVPGRDKFTAQNYVHNALTLRELDAAFRSDWIARKIVTIPAWDMTREWRGWQADPDQIELLENAEKKLFIQQKLQQALIKARLYGGAVIVIGVDAGAPEEELDPELVTQDSLKFLHVVSKNQIRSGPLIRDISSKYFGQPEYYEAQQEPVPKSFKQIPESVTPQYANRQVRLHPSRVVRLIGMDTADQMLTEMWGDSVLQPVNDAVKMCGLVTGSLATLVAELKVDVIKVPELKSILSTQAGERKMIARFQAANVAKSVINTILIDGNEEWQRIQASLTGVPETMMAYMQIAAGAADIPATRFLGMSPAGLNATGESDIRNYYDRLAAEQTTVLTPTMNVLDEVLIRSALGDRPPEVWYEWNSLWQLNETEKADIAVKKANAYLVDVNAAQLPPVALANARANQLIEDGLYPGLEKALEDAALEGDTIESENAPAPPPNPLDPTDPASPAHPLHPLNPANNPGGGGAPPFGGAGGSNVTPFPAKKPNPFAKKAFGGDAAPDDVDDFNEKPKGGTPPEARKALARASKSLGERLKQSGAALFKGKGEKAKGKTTPTAKQPAKGEKAAKGAKTEKPKAEKPAGESTSERAAKKAEKEHGRVVHYGDAENPQLCDQCGGYHLCSACGGALFDHNQCHGPDGKFCSDPSGGPTRAVQRQERAYTRAARSALGGGEGKTWEFPREEKPKGKYESPAEATARGKRNRKREAEAVRGEMERRIGEALRQAQNPKGTAEQAAVEAVVGIGKAARWAYGKLRRSKPVASKPAAAPVKRGRGRPRTRPLGPKRPRGRPRKH